MDAPPPSLSTGELIDRGLTQGITQVESVGSPLHPFLIDESGKVYLLFDNVGGMDPMQLALSAIKSNLPAVQRCALVMDTRIGGTDGKKMDAILVIACERDVERGDVWAQRYVPKGFLRKFKVHGEREKVAESRNFISAALAEA